MHWYLEVWRHYGDFSGRARRSEYWYFTLFNALIILVLYAIGAVAMTGARASSNSVPLAALVPYMLYILAALIPSLAVSVRRLHDIGKSAWWLFLALIPFVGGIWLLVLHCMDSQPGDNQWGPNPKATAQTLVATT